MKLLINSNAHKRASLGSKRYFNGVYKYLKNLKIDIFYSKKYNFGVVDRVMELFQMGKEDSIFWSPCHRGPIWARNHVITVLDCINIEYTYKNDWRLFIYKLLFSLIYNNSVKIVAISNATKNAIIRNYKIEPSKIVVISGPSYISMEDDLIYESGPITKIINKPFILLITNKTFHKNTFNGCMGILNSQLFRQKKYALVVVGSIDPAIFDDCKNNIDFHIFEKVSDSYLSYLYKHCSFLFSPSFDEGLNMPVAEALSLGVNVLCSDIPVHREFYDGYVKFFDPYDIADISKKIDEFGEIQGNWGLHQERFTGINFESVAMQYKLLFEELALELNLKCKTS
jgi:glycosyltransferase involved in cell wall biosynthesis